MPVRTTGNVLQPAIQDQVLKGRRWQL